MKVNPHKIVLISIVTILMVVAVPILTVILLSSPLPPPDIGPQPPKANTCPTLPLSQDTASGIGVTLVNTEYIGLSEGKFAFNTQSDPHQYKCLASQALSQGDVRKATSDWGYALALGSYDAEVAIYQENQRILGANLPYISIIVGVAATANDVNNSRDVLQGVFAAQRRYNQEHANSLQVRVMIANFGSTDATAMLVAQQIVTVAQKDDRIKAMVDLPELANTPDVRNKLAEGGVPIVLSTGSTSDQENGGNFFHVEATTKEQGQIAAQYVEQNCPNQNESRAFDCQGSQIIAFIDAGNNYSSSLGSAFMQQINADTATTGKSVVPIYYQANNFQSIANQIGASGASFSGLIYFAGNAAQAAELLRSLSKMPGYANIHLLGGDELYQTGQYQSNQPDGQDYYSHLSFTAFAYPDEWAILSPASARPEFFCDYAKDFAGGVVTVPGIPDCSGWSITAPGVEGYKYSRPENDVILSYDAASVVLVNIAGGILSRDQLLQSIRSTDFEGVSGHIAFGPDGNPVRKAILVLRVNSDGKTRLEQRYGVF